MEDIFWRLFWIFIMINSSLAVITIFRDKSRDITSIWAWLMVIIGMPGIGFVFYLFLGRRISNDNIYDLKVQDDIGLKELSKKLMHRYENDYDIAPKYASNKAEMIQLMNRLDNSALTRHNEVTLITDGYDKFSRLLEDISQAQEYIHLVYYIFKGDKIGKKLIDALEERASAGVEVRVLYDPLGTRFVNRSYLKKLKNFGGKTYPSFGQSIHLLNIRLNYRNHRKIVVIDGKIAYTGGFNVGDDYLGEYENMGYWRDTHLRIEGNAVLPLETRFLIDWNASAHKDDHIQYDDKYFPIQTGEGDADIQVVSSGPDDDEQQIKKGFIKMISLAKKSVFIQTPYFVPDDALLETLEVTVKSGVDVRLMIPNKPDHPFIYRATLSYAEQLVEAGVKVYIYDAGFLHAKTMTIDGEMMSVGTANFDIRSFKLNFEINTFIYNTKLTQQYNEIFKKDMESSYRLTKDIISEYSLWERFKQQFSRLLSPIL